MQGNLFIVSTPIGNLEDITLRALRILKEVDIIICEDTRHTKKLLNHYQIYNKPLISFFTYNQYYRTDYIIEELKLGKRCALLTDAGTPGISDPGNFLIERVIKEGIPVVPLPGASAFLTALSASGLCGDGFVFLGFLKRKPGKIKKELINAAKIDKTIIFYESPKRVTKTLKICLEIFSGDSRVVIARELTKKFEEFIRCNLSNIVEEVLNKRDLIGEVVVLIEPKKLCKEIPV